ncbi:ankyrin [Massarina eburnea CBS 473.64]|uniref:Ankyrin n=1 Tax=Massarina eburnea CBS 473.64 TaxID=1395130 RepID=A0A6A6RSK0_9PLEO|nr:ankyrin [Massarina eburnea CBS 473.64]
MKLKKSLSCISLSKTDKEVEERHPIPIDAYKDNTRTGVRGHNEEGNRVSKIQTLIEVLRCELARPGKGSNAVTEKGLEPGKEWTPLYHAVCHNREAALLHFLRTGQSPDGLLGSDLPPIYIATAYGHVGIVKILGDAGADVNASAKQNGETALHIAIKNGRNDIVDVILSHGPNVNAKTIHTGETPLHYAAAESVSLATVAALLKQGANYEALDAEIRTPAEVALQSQNLHAAVAIVSAARGKRKLIKEKEMLLQYVEKAQNRLSMNNELIADIFEAGCPSNSTVLIEAIKRNDASLVEMFLEKGADPNRATSSGILPIFAALSCSSAHIVHALVLHKADVTLRDVHGLTVLQAALDSPLAQDKEAMPRLFEILLSSGADSRVKYSDGSTLLHRAVGQELGLAKVAQRLVQCDINVNEQDRCGNTALHLAYHSRLCTAVLLKHGTDVTIVNKKGLTPLLYATRQATKEKEPDLEELIRASDIRKTDSARRTPLHFASRNGLEKTVRTLLQAGADTTFINSKKPTPLILAVLYHQWNVVPLLAAQSGINSWDEEGRTALHHIAMCTPRSPSTWNDIATAVAPFCEKGVSRSMRDKSGATPLIQAVKSLPEQGLPVIEMLLSRRGSEKSNCVGHEDLQSKDALFYAATLGKATFVAALLQSGSPFTLKEWRPSKGRVRPDNDVGKQILKTMAEHDWLRRAAILQRQSIGVSNESILPKVLPVRDLQQLLTMGLDPNALPKSKVNSPLLWIILNQISQRHSFISDYLHDAIKLVFIFRADPNALSTRSLRRTSQMRSPQQQATSLTIHPLTFLLEQFPDINIKIINLFLDNAAKLTIPSTFYDGRYPLHSAILTNRPSTLPIFLSHKVDINSLDAKNRTPLFLAAEKGFHEPIQVLLRSGAKVDAKDMDGNTPLHVSAQTGNKTVVSLLLCSGAKAWELNTKGKLPRDLVPATSAEREEILDLLKRAEEEEQQHHHQQQQQHLNIPPPNPRTSTSTSTSTSTNPSPTPQHPAPPRHPNAPIEANGQDTIHATIASPSSYYFPTYFIPTYFIRAHSIPSRREAEFRYNNGEGSDSDAGAYR